MAALAIPFAIKGLSSLFGGLQSRSAINDAVAALLDSYNKAGGIASDTVNSVNPNIYANADVWGNKMVDAGNAAGDAAVAAGDRGIAGINSAVTSGQATMDPYVSSGSSAAKTLAGILQDPSSFHMANDPGYQFRLEQGQKAIRQSMAARGASGGGGAAKALAQFNSGLASEEFGNAWNRQVGGLQSLAGLGERAGEFSGDLGLRGSTSAAGIGLDASKFAGSARMSGTNSAASLWSHATDEMSNNQLDLGNFLANLAVKGGQAQAQGDLGRAGIWNQVIGDAGSAITDYLKARGGKK